jgi:hypothetical protein
MAQNHIQNNRAILALNIAHAASRLGPNDIEDVLIDEGFDCFDDEYTEFLIAQHEREFGYENMIEEAGIAAYMGGAA